MTEQEQARDAIRTEYETSNRGIIQSPGKFENEPEYAPYFWNFTLDGSAEILDWSDGATTHLVTVEDGDRAAWPSLGVDTIAVHVQESDTGFVTCETLNAGELAMLNAENEADSQLSNDDYDNYDDDESDDPDDFEAESAD